MKSKMGALSLAVVAGLALAGCTVDGSAVEDPSQMIDESKFDTGDYPTEPRPEFGYSSEDDISFIEGQRMAEFTTLPSEIDPGLVEVDDAMVVRSANNLSVFFQGDVETFRDSLVSGFFSSFSESTDKSTEPQRRLIQTVMRLVPADTAKATRAYADSMAKAENTTVDTKTMPGSFIVRYTQKQGYGETAYDSPTTVALTPRGRYMIITAAAGKGADDKEWPETSVKKGLELQGPLIDKFPESHSVDAVKLDQNKILIYALPVKDPNDLYWLTRAVYGPRGIAHLGGASMGLLETAGAEHTAFEASTVYRAADENKAIALEAGVIKELKEQGYTNAASPPGLPIATCLEKPDDKNLRVSCFVRVGRYIGDANNALTSYSDAKADQLTDTHKQITAQYKILLKADQKAN